MSNFGINQVLTQTVRNQGVRRVVKKLIINGVLYYDIVKESDILVLFRGLSSN